MKSTRITALAAIGVAVTLSLTACGNGGSGKAGNDPSATGSLPASSSTPSASGSKPADSDSKPAGGSGSGGSAAAPPGDGGQAADGSAKTSGKITFCKTADLAIDARDAAPDKSSGRIDITMVNRGSATCSATGFAGVDIKDADHTSSPVERGHAQPRVTVLKPGDAAVFDLAYDIDATGHSLTSPTGILVTPPNENHTVTLKWPAGAGPIKGAYTDVEVYPTHTTE
ncbi:DUF4232 domain-containing protein [Streptomyces sp. AM6-12]|uniref:DUF4232 domain-containing protein n=1 Tax=Streptomyces sp. AM6-12 TaxID=3345149 RepID=UPI0037B4F53D